MKETVLILDFGGQYSQLIARRIRENNVYCEVLAYSANIDRIKSYNLKGIILAGGPAGIYNEDLLRCSKEVFDLGCPILGVGYGVQLIADMMGGSVKIGGDTNSVYVKTSVKLSKESVLFKNADENNICWMNHNDFVTSVPSGFIVTGLLEGNEIVAIEDSNRKIYGMQFHPEVSNTDNGIEILRAFLYDICKVTGDWTMLKYAQDTVANLKDKFQDKKVLLALSGGVDSSVCAAMIGKAVGKNLTCIFVDHGLLRKYEREQIEQVFNSKFDINLITIDARERFLNKLAGVSDPETKRKIIGKEFIEVFQEEATKLGAMDFFVQGTIYPDVIESGITGSSAVIKSHHNVGGLPKDMKFGELVEPLRYLFKDEVRKCGLELGLSEEIVMRQPFPGPGLGIRVIGDITEDKLKIVRDSDHIFREEVKKAGLDRSINQYFTVLTNMRSVGVTNDKRTYDYTLALRAVTTTDFMTANWARIPYDVLDIVSRRIVNEVENVNRIVYDITSKPPATIEWE